MRQIDVSTRLVVSALLALLALGSCFAEPNGVKGAGGMPAAVGGSLGGNSVVDEGGGGAAGGEAPVCKARPLVEGAECRPVTSAEPLRARIVDDVPQDTLFSTEQLAGQFAALCGSCHGASGLGGLSVARSNFATVVDEKVWQAMQSNTATCELDDKGQKKDPSCYDYMPPVGSPNGKPWSERKDDVNDPVTRFSALIRLWLDAKSPDDAFVIPASSAVGSTTPYAIDADFAETFTNIGTCVPDAGMVATELDQSCELDAKFAALQKKPESNLPEEQLGLPPTLDQTDLTTFDSAELARHGVVAYAPTYPLWSDNAGKLRYVRVPQGQSIKFDKKTRQFDIPKNTRFYKTFLKKILDRDGVERYRKIETRLIVSRSGEESLFGTYEWNQTETQATLVTDPLNNGLPFRDKLITVITDVAKADAVKAQWNAGKVRNYTKELDYQGLQRRYAIPGSERCLQCHMGGVGQSFVLGFTPLDLYSRACDADTLAQKGACDGGIIEPATGDELTQLDRFIDYGVITDYDVKTQLVQLEDDQGTKAAPRKLRTLEELRAQAYMLGNCAHCHNPDGYPSVLNPELKPLLNFRPSEEGGIFEFPLERYSPRILRELGKIQLPYITPSLRDIYTPIEDYKEKRVNTDHVLKFIDAPWRSLIYRNVDTPFTYSDDLTIFPHMPLNTPGFDCRAPRFIGEWMVSIPALRKDPSTTEDVGSDNTTRPDNEPQPYYEVKPGDPSYLNALAQAQKRLAAYRKGLRDNNYCPETKDIVDVFDILYGPPPEPPLTPQDGRVKGLPVEGVPDRPHWVITDLTDPPGEWNPRRTDWKTKLVEEDFTEDQKFLDDNFSGVTLEQKQRDLDNQKLAVSLLQTAELTGNLKEYVTTKLPFGLWQQQNGCDFSSVPKVGDYPDAAKPRWMKTSPPLDAKLPVYESLPGAAVFNMICVNCHGPDADSKGRQATTLQELTGGVGRVANFRDGLFGPPGQHGANRQRVFGSDQQAMKYLAWMALGGTKTHIPSIILNLVAATPVLGAPRPEAPPVVNANMLETGRAMCRAIVARGFGGAFKPSEMGTAAGRAGFHEQTPFLLGNGDVELWQKLCLFDNPSPIHGVSVSGPDNDGAYNFFANTVDLLRPDTYPANTPVGNIDGVVEPSLAAGNDFPWCVIAPTDPKALAFVNAQKGAHAEALPLCPPSFVVNENKISVDGPEVARFATRGAINAGFSVFAYLDSFVSEGNGRALSFSECSQLPKAGTP